MTIRFAAAKGRIGNASAYVQRQVHIPVPANDDRDEAEQDAIMRAALRHFAEHGLSAAREARKKAETAFFAGEQDAYNWWLAICRALDRKLAVELVKHTHAST